MLFYKVVELKKKSFAKGYMTAWELQAAINRWANMGWSLDRIAEAETQHLLHTKDVLLLIFKKDIKLPQGMFAVINNQEVGPLTDMQLAGFNQSGQLAPQTMVRINGQHDAWQPLAQVFPDLISANYF